MNEGDHDTALTDAQENERVHEEGIQKDSIPGSW